MININRKYFKNGMLREIHQHDGNDIKNGFSYRYWNNGNLMIEETYRYNENDGPYKQYYRSGKIEINCNYHFGYYFYY